MTHIWSFDPGLYSGWSHLVFKPDGILQGNECGETDHYGLGDMLRAREFSGVFVSESFTITPKKAPAPWSLESIGLLRYFAYLYEIPFELVAPSQHKGLISDAIIKRAGLWIPGKGHAMDATRVGMWYAVVKRGLLHNCLVA